MATNYLVLFVYIATCFIHAESVKCIKCNSEEKDSPCQLGSADTSFECPADEQSCYKEYFIHDDVPLFRRGCSPSDWCDTQKNHHGDYFKYCKTCDGEKCNNGTMDDTEIMKCMKCSSEDYDSPCRLGSADTFYECPAVEQSCYTESITSNGKPLYRRGCSDPNWCDSQKVSHSDELKYCKTCDGQKCNNGTIGRAKPLKCISCSSNEYNNSPCRVGTAETVSECSGEDQHCYEEYSIIEDEPIYTRGCSNSQVCNTRKSQHGNDVKYCEVCDTDKCNNGAIGDPKERRLQCYTCSTDDSDDRCRTGGTNYQRQLCPRSNKNCFYEYISADGYQLWRRGCSKDDYCQLQEKKHMTDLTVCETCSEDLCNTDGMRKNILMNYHY